jgi:hypothetical protein
MGRAGVAELYGFRKGMIRRRDGFIPAGADGGPFRSFAAGEAGCHRQRRNDRYGAHRAVT